MLRIFETNYLRRSAALCSVVGTLGLAHSAQTARELSPSAARHQAAEARKNSELGAVAGRIAQMVLCSSGFSQFKDNYGRNGSIPGILASYQVETYALEAAMGLDQNKQPSAAEVQGVQVRELTVTSDTIIKIVYDSGSKLGWRAARRPYILPSNSSAVDYPEINPLDIDGPVRDDPVREELLAKEALSEAETAMSLPYLDEPNTNPYCQ